MAEIKKIKIVDTTLRDGSHAVSHTYSIDQVNKISRGLAEANVDYIEISHGDGLNGSSQNYGWASFSDKEKLNAAKSAVSSVNNSDSKITVLLIPGIGTVEDLQMAKESGAVAARIATHVTEADISEEHIKYSKKLGLITFGFLMMAHMASVETVVEQAKLFEAFGADVLYVADSAGAMLPDDVATKISALDSELEIPIGFHAHNNLGLAVANSIVAIKSGASYIDACCRGIGAGAGNTPTEVLIGVLQKYNYETNVDFYKITDVAEDIVAPIMKYPQNTDKASLMLGYAGVYSSFLLHTFKAAKKFKLDPRDILVELGKRKMVGGQEDMIIEVAYNMANKS